MKWFISNVLLLVVFLTGFCVLVIEIAALRVLTPYFGNTIFSATSVISVILAALSLGYYFGGRYADKYPKLSVFYLLIFASGTLTLVSQIMSVVALPLFAYKLGLKSGPMISSIILFTLPAFILGMLSPFAIKLQEISHPKVGIGTLAGNIFFASTVGSILGSVFTGFYFIPNFGITTIFISAGVFLCLLGIVGLIASKLKKKIISAVVLIFALILSIDISLNQLNTNPNVVYSKDGVYEKLVIIDDIYNGRPARRFFQDRSASSALYTDTGELVYDYSKYYSVYKIINPEIKNALVLGGGAYTIPKVLLEEHESIIVDVVEIEPELFEISKEYYDIPDDGRIVNHVVDGRRFLHDTEMLYDLIFSDVYFSIASVPTHFTTVEFFEIAKSRLTDDGVFVANIIGQISHTSPNFLMSEIKTFREVFPNSFFFAVKSPNILSQQNIIFVGARDGVNFDYSSFGERYEIDLARQLIDMNRFSLDNQIVFTDNYAPVESLGSEMIDKIGFDYSNKIDGYEVMALIRAITSITPRSLGTEGHIRVRDLIKSEVTPLADTVLIQEWNEGGFDFENIVARFNPDVEERLILGTHYDNKRFADRDQKVTNKEMEVPGANDSASGTALLIEIARILRYGNMNNIGVDIVFFDGEEGLIDHQESDWYPVGSTYFADNIQALYLNELPTGGIIVDMICDKNLELPIETNSYELAPDLLRDVYKIGMNSYPTVFLPDSKFTIGNDHMPLNASGIPSILLIDFDYSYFHTTKDTVDKCSPQSLETVGEVLLTYLRSL